MEACIVKQPNIQQKEVNTHQRRNTANSKSCDFHPHPSQKRDERINNIENDSNKSILPRNHDHKRKSVKERLGDKSDSTDTRTQKNRRDRSRSSLRDRRDGSSGIDSRRQRSEKSIVGKSRRGDDDRYSDSNRGRDRDRHSSRADRKRSGVDIEMKSNHRGDRLFNQNKTDEKFSKDSDRVGLKRGDEVDSSPKVSQKKTALLKNHESKDNEKSVDLIKSVPKSDIDKDESHNRKNVTNSNQEKATHQIKSTDKSLDNHIVEKERRDQSHNDSVKKKFSEKAQQSDKFVKYLDKSSKNGKDQSSVPSGCHRNKNSNNKQTLSGHEPLPDRAENMEYGIETIDNLKFLPVKESMKVSKNNNDVVDNQSVNDNEENVNEKVNDNQECLEQSSTLGMNDNSRQNLKVANKSLLSGKYLKDEKVKKVMKSYKIPKLKNRMQSSKKNPEMLEIETEKDTQGVSSEKEDERWVIENRMDKVDEMKKVDYSKSSSQLRSRTYKEKDQNEEEIGGEDELSKSLSETNSGVIDLSCRDSNRSDNFQKGVRGGINKESVVENFKNSVRREIGDFELENNATKPVADIDDGNDGDDRNDLRKQNSCGVELMLKGLKDSSNRQNSHENNYLEATPLIGASKVKEEGKNKGEDLTLALDSCVNIESENIRAEVPSILENVTKSSSEKVNNQPTVYPPQLINSSRSSSLSGCKIIPLERIEKTDDKVSDASTKISAADCFVSYQKSDVSLDTNFHPTSAQGDTDLPCDLSTKLQNDSSAKTKITLSDQDTNNTCSSSNSASSNLPFSNLAEDGTSVRKVSLTTSTKDPPSPSNHTWPFQVVALSENSQQKNTSLLDEVGGDLHLQLSLSSTSCSSSSAASSSLAVQLKMQSSDQTKNSVGSVSANKDARAFPIKDLEASASTDKQMELTPETPAIASFSSALVTLEEEEVGLPPSVSDHITSEESSSATKTSTSQSSGEALSSSSSADTIGQKEDNSEMDSVLSVNQDNGDCVSETISCQISAPQPDLLANANLTPPRVRRQNPRTTPSKKHLTPTPISPHTPRRSARKKLMCTPNLIVLGDEETSGTLLSPYKQIDVPTDFYPPGMRMNLMEVSTHRHIRGAPELLHTGSSSQGATIASEGGTLEENSKGESDFSKIYSAEVIVVDGHEQIPTSAAESESLSSEAVKNTFGSAFNIRYEDFKQEMAEKADAENRILRYRLLSYMKAFNLRYKATQIQISKKQSIVSRTSCVKPQKAGSASTYSRLAKKRKHPKQRQWTTPLRKSTHEAEQMHLVERKEGADLDAEIAAGDEIDEPETCKSKEKGCLEDRVETAIITEKESGFICSKCQSTLPCSCQKLTLKSKKQTVERTKYTEAIGHDSSLQSEDIPSRSRQSASKSYSQISDVRFSAPSDLSISSSAFSFFPKDASILSEDSSQVAGEKDPDEEISFAGKISCLFSNDDAVDTTFENKNQEMGRGPEFEVQNLLQLETQSRTTSKAPVSSKLIEIDDKCKNNINIAKDSSVLINNVDDTSCTKRYLKTQRRNTSLGTSTAAPSKVEDSSGSIGLDHTAQRRMSPIAAEEADSTSEPFSVLSRRKTVPLFSASRGSEAEVHVSAFKSNQPAKTFEEERKRLDLPDSPQRPVRTILNKMEESASHSFAGKSPGKRPVRNKNQNGMPRGSLSTLSNSLFPENDDEDGDGTKEAVRTKGSFSRPNSKTSACVRMSVEDRKITHQSTNRDAETEKEGAKRHIANASEIPLNLSTTDTSLTDRKGDFQSQEYRDERNFISGERSSPNTRVFQRTISKENVTPEFKSSISQRTSINTALNSNTTHNTKSADSSPVGDISSAEASSPMFRRASRYQPPPPPIDELSLDARSLSEFDQDIHHVLRNRRATLCRANSKPTVTSTLSCSPCISVGHESPMSASSSIRLSVSTPGKSPVGSIFSPRDWDSSCDLPFTDEVVASGETLASHSQSEGEDKSRSLSSKDVVPLLSRHLSIQELRERKLVNHVATVYSESSSTSDDSGDDNDGDSNCCKTNSSSSDSDKSDSDKESESEDGTNDNQDDHSPHASTNAEVRKIFRGKVNSDKSDDSSNHTHDNGDEMMKLFEQSLSESDTDNDKNNDDSNSDLYSSEGSQSNTTVIHRQPTVSGDKMKPATSPDSGHQIYDEDDSDDLDSGDKTIVNSDETSMSPTSASVSKSNRGRRRKSESPMKYVKSKQITQMQPRAKDLNLSESSEDEDGSLSNSVQTYEGRRILQRPSDSDNVREYSTGVDARESSERKSRYSCRPSSARKMVRIVEPDSLDCITAGTLLSPDKSHFLLKRLTESPRKRVLSPLKNIQSSHKNVQSSHNKVHSPIKKVQSPCKKILSPHMKGQSSTTKKVMIPSISNPRQNVQSESPIPSGENSQTSTSSSSHSRIKRGHVQTQSLSATNSSTLSRSLRISGQSPAIKVRDMPVQSSSSSSSSATTHKNESKSVKSPIVENFNTSRFSRLTQRNSSVERERAADLSRTSSPKTWDKQSLRNKKINEQNNIKSNRKSKNETFVKCSDNQREKPGERGGDRNTNAVKVRDLTTETSVVQEELKWAMAYRKNVDRVKLKLDSRLNMPPSEISPSVNVEQELECYRKSVSHEIESTSTEPKSTASVDSSVFQEVFGSMSGSDEEDEDEKEEEDQEKEISGRSEQESCDIPHEVPPASQNIVADDDNELEDGELTDDDEDNNDENSDGQINCDISEYKIKKISTGRLKSDNSAGDYQLSKISSKPNSVNRHRDISNNTREGIKEARPSNSNISNSNSKPMSNRRGKSFAQKTCSDYRSPLASQTHNKSPRKRYDSPYSNNDRNAGHSQISEDVGNSNSIGRPNLPAYRRLEQRNERRKRPCSPSPKDEVIDGRKGSKQRCEGLKQSGRQKEPLNSTSYDEDKFDNLDNEDRRKGRKREDRRNSRSRDRERSPSRSPPRRRNAYSSTGERGHDKDDSLKERDRDRGREKDRGHCDSGSDSNRLRNGGRINPAQRRDRTQRSRRSRDREQQSVRDRGRERPLSPRRDQRSRSGSCGSGGGSRRGEDRRDRRQREDREDRSLHKSQRPPATDLRCLIGNKNTARERQDSVGDRN